MSNRSHPTALVPVSVTIMSSPGWGAGRACRLAPFALRGPEAAADIDDGAVERGDNLLESLRALDGELAGVVPRVGAFHEGLADGGVLVDDLDR